MFLLSWEWLVGVVVASQITVAPWFFMLARLKNMGYHAELKDLKRFGEDFGWIIGSLVILFALWGVIADVFFNWVVGSVIYREVPREFLFTERTERWYKSAMETIERQSSDGMVPLKPEGEPVPYDGLNRRQNKGLLWGYRLNRIMPGHVG